MVRLTLTFSGGLEILFGNQKELDVEVPAAGGELFIRQLLIWARDNILTERPELFMKDDSVCAHINVHVIRPGILVLVNDVDWELSGYLDSELEEGDNVVFISTLHGG